MNYLKQAFPLKILLRTNILNDVTAAPFSMSFSQQPAVKNTENGAAVTSLRTFVRSSDFSKYSKLKGETQHYVVKLTKSAGARHYCLKIPRVPGTLGTRANSSPDYPNFKGVQDLSQSI